jgi:hypothetical protein
MKARDFEATANTSQASWMQEALCRTAIVSYVAMEACEMAAQVDWDPRKCDAYHGLRDREEGKLDETYEKMWPDELPRAVAGVAEVWLDDAYDNITLAQACMTAKK